MAENYYVGSSLDTIGNNMVADRNIQARSQAAQMEQQRLQYQALMQHLYQQQAQAQQAQQFQQELALRSQGQTQEQQYRNAMLGLQQKQQEFAQTGYSPAQEWEQQFREKELGSRERIAQYGQNQIGQQALAAMINQQGLTGRTMQEADEYWQDMAISSESKASDYNASVNEIKKQGNEIRKKRGWGPNDPESRDAQAKIFESGKYSELINSLQSIDKRPGNVSPVIQPDGSYKFVAINRTRPQGQPQSGFNPAGINPLTFGQPQTNTVTGIDPRQAALIQALQGGQDQSMSNVNAPTNVATVPGPQQGYQQELAQLQAAARSGLIDKATYAQRRREIDTKYGVFSR